MVARADFRLLGRMEVRADGGEVAISAAKHRVLLAALLLHSNETVDAGQLAIQLWGDDPPRTARATLQTYVQRLRHVLGDNDRIATTSTGYRISVEPGELDLIRFRMLVEEAAELADPADQADVLRRALTEWRGRPLADVPSSLMQTEELPLLEEERLRALELLFDVELKLGNHRTIIRDLQAITAEHPLHEGFCGQLMLALHRSGRQAEAFAAYQNLTTELVEQLGVDPGSELRAIHQAVLTDSPEATGLPVRPRVVPRQLPPAPAAFVGRSRELEVLPDAGTTVISAIGGLGGIGKTWLALHWAHRAADHFPDGQLFVNLNGFDESGRPMPSDVAVRGFLDALGVESVAVPADPHARVGLYRSLMADKRMLVILDNARDAAQVIPLLPGSSTCTVLITSRDRMHSLTATHGVRTVKLGTLSDDEARALLTRRLGTDRVEREPEAVAELVARCGRLPLALGIVAGRAAAQPAFPITALVSELRDAGLDALDAGAPDADLAAVLSWSSAVLNPLQNRVFTLMGQAPVDDITSFAAANLAGTTLARARSALRALEAMSLIDEHQPGRFRMHDLVRKFAAERSDADDMAQRRLADFYLHTAQTGDGLTYPQFRLPVAPPSPAHDLTSFPLQDERAVQEWFDREYLNLLVAQRHAADRGWHDVVWHFARATNNMLVRGGRMREVVEFWELALLSAQHLGPYFSGRAHRCLGLAVVRERGAAVSHLRRALELFEEIEDRREQSYTHRDLAYVHGELTEYEQAIVHAKRARDLSQALAEPVHEASALNMLGEFLGNLGQHAEGVTSCERALELFRSHGYADGESYTLESLGLLAHQTGRYDEALGRYREALGISITRNLLFSEPILWTRIARTHVALTDLDEARAALRTAMELFRGQGRAREAEQVRRELEELNGEGPG